VRTYLVDGSNAVRRGNYDSRFPEVEEAEIERWLGRLVDLAAPLAGGIRIEVFFDGPRRSMPPAADPVFVRFPIDGYADDAILGTARQLLNMGRGAVVVTQDGGLAGQLEEEGARVIGFSQLEDRLRRGQA
jgi:hypothetical protein